MLKMMGVEMLGGIHYERITPEGLWVSQWPQREDLELIPADTIVSAPARSRCANWSAAAGSGASVHLIGGALEAGELDAKRAIPQGTQLGVRLWRPRGAGRAACSELQLAHQQLLLVLASRRRGTAQQGVEVTVSWPGRRPPPARCRWPRRPLPPSETGPCWAPTPIWPAFVDQRQGRGVGIDAIAG